MFANCYKGRRVFITGHTGFKGSWLAAWLSQMGATVCGFADCVPTSPSHFEAMHLEQHVQDMRGDIRDRDAVVRAMKEFRPDVVFHLAAQALVRKSYEDAPLTFEANMLGTLNMLEAVRQCPSVEAAVFITSDKCYRNDEWVWGYRETDHLGGDDPYSASKAAPRSSPIPISRAFSRTARPAPPCVPATSSAAVTGPPTASCPTAPAPGPPVRPCRSAAPGPPAPGSWCWSPCPAICGWAPICWVRARGPSRPAARPTTSALPPTSTIPWRKWWRPWPCTGPASGSEMDKAGQAGMKECTLLKLCCDKALAHLGWKATLTFEETIRFTAEWYHRFYRGDGAKQGSMLDFSLGQIAAYVNAAEQREQLWTK